MVNLLNGVKKFSAPMFFTFVVSKVVLGIGLGVVLYQYLQPIGWLCLIVGIVVSVACVVLAAKNV